MAIRGGGDVKQLLLQVDASVALAQRNLGQLAAQVERDSSRMDRALGSIDGATTRVGAAFGKLSSAIGTFGVAIGGAAIVSFGRDILQFADDLDAAASRAGIGVERFQTLTEAFRTLEVDAEQVDKIFQRLLATLGAVQNGVDDEATKALDRLGLRARILSGEIADPAQLLDALAAAATNAGTQAQFADAMADIFGRRMSGQLVPALVDGGVALHDLEQAMRDSGTVIETEVVQQLAEANEKIDAFISATRRQATILAGDLIPWLEAGGRAIQDFGDWMADLSDRTNLVVGSMYPLIGRLMQLDEVAARLSGRRFGASLGEAVAGLPVARNAGVIGAFQTNLAFARRRRAEIAAFGGDGDGGGGGSRRGGGGGRSRAARAQRAQRVEPSDFVSPWALGPTRGEMDAELGAEGLERIDWAATRAEELNAILVDLPTLDDLLSQDAAERLGRFAQDFRRDLAGGLADAVVYGRDLGDALVNSLKRAAAAMLESQLFQLLGGGSGGFGGGFGGGGLYGGGKGGGLGGGFNFGGLLGSLFGGGGGGLKLGGGKAGGGPVVPGTVYPVGEEGVELFAPRVPGVIIPNRALGGGQSVNNYYLSGNLLTPDFWRKIQAGDASAAQRGAMGGMAEVYRRADRTFP